MRAGQKHLAMLDGHPITSDPGHERLLSRGPDLLDHEPVPQARACHREDYPVDYSGTTVGGMDGNASTASHAIEALSVLGDRFDIQLAVEVSGQSPADLLRALDSAERQGLVL